MKRIDQLAPGTIVMLGYADNSIDRAEFVGITGEGDDRTATFRQPRTDGETFEWDAYRYRKAWAYGSSGQRLRLVQIITEPVAA